MKKKMGRPTVDPKNAVINIRATREDREKLLYCCRVTGKTQYEVVMEGINAVFEGLKMSVMEREEDLWQEEKCLP